MKTTEECPVCGSKDFNSKFKAEDHAVSQEVFNVDECNGCGLLFTNPRPSDTDLGRYYASPSYISHTNQASGLFGRTYQALRFYNIKRKIRSLNRLAYKGQILDYGCGTGEFLAECKQQGWVVQGVELNDAVRKTASLQHNIDVLPPTGLDNISCQTFDVVTMWHVLEHVSELKKASKQIVDRIKVGGYLVIAIPNPESWDAKHYAEFWAAWDLPIHLYHFKKRNVEDLFASFGMELVKIQKMPLDAFYISLLSEEYKNGRKRWFLAFFVGLLSNISSLGKKNTSSLTYVFKKVQA